MMKTNGKRDEENVENLKPQEAIKELEMICNYKGITVKKINYIHNNSVLYFKDYATILIFLNATEWHISCLIKNLQ